MVARSEPPASELHSWISIRAELSDQWLNRAGGAFTFGWLSRAERYPSSATPSINTSRGTGCAKLFS